MVTGALLRKDLEAIARSIWREICILAKLEFIPEQSRGSVLFALRSCSATALALYMAFFLQLDQPYWAGMAIWMVTQPTPGMAISKSFYRIIGTLIGSAMGVVLIAFFAQTPELFILALALWIGACTVASNLLRNFRAYATVLAGYTAAIISLGTYTNPNNVFNIAMARGSATIIGILCAAVITSLFAPHETERKVMVRLREAIVAAARRFAIPAAASLREKIAVGKPLIDELIALDAEIEYAAAESASFRIHADGARSLLAHLFGAIAAKRSLDARLQRSRDLKDRELASIHASVMTLLGGVAEMMVGSKRKDLEAQIENLRAELAKLAPEESGKETEQIVTSRFVNDRLEDLLRHLGRAVYDFERLQGGWKWQPSLSLNFHRDQRLAWINGARAVLAVMAAGIFWVESAWSSGAGLLIQVTVACSLFAAAPRPDKAAAAFLLGGVFAAGAAFICNFYFLTNISGFPLMALIYMVFLAPGAVIFLNPKISFIGLAYCVSFLAISRPLNPMDYDIVSFLNNVIATLGGIGFGVMAYKLFLPPDPRAARRYVIYRIRLGLQRISHWNPITKPCDWQTRMFDRINRLHDPENPSGTTTDEWFDGGLSSVNLGNEVIRLRLLLAENVLSARVACMARSILTAFEELVTNPYPAELIVRTTKDALQQTQPEGDKEKRRAWYRVLGMIEEMDAFFSEHPRFLTPT